MGTTIATWSTQCAPILSAWSVVYSIDALAPDAVQRIDHWEAQGLHGFRLFTTGTTMPGQSDWLGHKDSYPAWAQAEKKGIPVCLQMTMQGLPMLRTLLEHYSEIACVARSLRASRLG